MPDATVPTPSSQAPASRFPLSALTLLAASLAAGLSGYGALLTASTVEGSVSALRESNERLAAEVAELRDRIELFRIEQDVDGLGTGAVLERIETFAAALTTANAAVEVPKIKKRLEEAVGALQTLGPEAFDEALAAYDEQSDDLVRSWLLFALLRVDPDRGKQVAARTLRATAHKPSQEMRLLAAKQLRLYDPVRAGEELERLLLTSSARGVSRKRIPPSLLDEYSRIELAATQHDTFHNFVTNYLRCDPPNAGRTLHQLIGRQDHDAPTINVCIKALGEMGFKEAAPQIEAYYHRPPGNFMNPLFRSNCLRALGQLRGGDACSFFQEELIKETDETVRNVLQEMVRQYCGQ